VERVSAAHVSAGAIFFLIQPKLSIGSVFVSKIPAKPALNAQTAFLILFFTLHVVLISAQEEIEEVFIIREIEFDIDGRTRPFALLINGEFREGERIKGRQNLDRYLERKRQILINMQVLEEVWIEYFTGESEEDGALPVSLLIHVKDSKNTVFIPYPKYDSNDGFSITLKARDYNFFGTMSPLKADLGYNQKDGENTVNFSFESAVPFQAASLNWTLVFDHFLSYTFEKPLYYQNVTGLSLALPWHITAFRVGFNQYLTVNEENSDETREIYGLDERYHGPYGSTELFAAWQIPLGLEVGDYGKLAYTPGVSGRVNYPYGTMDEPRKPVSTLSHSLGFGMINWMGNYRKGLSASIGNSFSWYFDRIDAPLKIALDGNTQYFHQFSKYLGFSSRLLYRQWWQYSERLDDFIPYYSAGDSARGILNEDIRAYQILSLNLDLPIRALRFWPSEWFNSPKLRFFDFEMHLSPFSDLVLFKGPYSKLKDKDNPASAVTGFSIDDMINTAGIEVIVFPASFRSLKIRASVGNNIKKIKNDGLSFIGGVIPKWDEIFIGLDHFY
jgi:outer membrane protein assembly factor BamA